PLLCQQRGQGAAPPTRPQKCSLQTQTCVLPLGAGTDAPASRIGKYKGPVVPFHMILWVSLRPPRPIQKSYLLHAACLHTARTSHVGQFGLSGLAGKSTLAMPVISLLARADAAFVAASSTGTVLRSPSSSACR